MKKYEQLFLCLSSGGWVLSHDSGSEYINIKTGYLSADAWVMPAVYLIETYGVEELELQPDGVRVGENFLAYCQRRGIRIVWK